MSLVLLTMGIAAANFAIGFALAIYLGHGPSLDSLLWRCRASSENSSQSSSDS